MLRNNPHSLIAALDGLLFLKETILLGKSLALLSQLSDTFASNIASPSLLYIPCHNDLSERANLVANACLNSAKELQVLLVECLKVLHSDSSSQDSLKLSIKSFLCLTHLLQLDSRLLKLELLTITILLDRDSLLVDLMMELVLCQKFPSVLVLKHTDIDLDILLSFHELLVLGLHISLSLQAVLLLLLFKVGTILGFSLALVCDPILQLLDLICHHLLLLHHLLFLEEEFSVLGRAHDFDFTRQSSLLEDAVKNLFLEQKRVFDIQILHDL